MAQVYSRSTNGKLYNCGPLYDNLGVQVTDSESPFANPLTAYIPLPYARVKEDSMSETIANTATFSVEFLDEFSGLYIPATRDVSVAVDTEHRVLFTDYLVGGESTDDRIIFEEYVMGSDEVNALI